MACQLGWLKKDISRHYCEIASLMAYECSIRTFDLHQVLKRAKFWHSDRQIQMPLNC
jgi:hypothetical protein